ncbi:cytidine deaminase [Microlunatus elymi]|uniref:cytidine deaminase n=1 Tax=Microlunatus elymi TaxID=2596828 RepID=UPI00143D2AC4
MTDRTDPEPLERPSEPEDLKIITLARSALARSANAQSGQGACLRDTDGRTYAGTRVDLDHLKLSAIQVVVAMAVSSGALGVEAVAVAGTGPSEDDLALIADLPGEQVTVWLTDGQGTVQDRIDIDD